VLSPIESGEYVISAAPGANVLHLAARAAPGTRKLYWFIDGRLTATARPGRKTPWTMTPGRHKLIVADDAGNCSALSFTVFAQDER
jgi:membrane carboxypeptidase/penicillin-binding protein PbpC